MIKQYFWFRYCISLIIIFLSQSCQNDDTIRPINVNKTEGVFIINEGNFTYGNSSLSFYHKETDSVENNVFSRVNQVPLGDVGYSMSIRDSLAYIVVNNSGKIYVIDKNTFKFVNKIDGLKSPRYIHFVDETKMYISELYDQNITIANTQTYEITGYINLHQPVEQFIEYRNYIFTISWNLGNQIFIINKTTDTVVDSFTVTKQPNSMALDKNNTLWVLCDGGYQGIPGGKANPALVKIHAETFTIQKYFEFKDKTQRPASLCINNNRDSLLYINGDIWAMDINADQLPTVPFIPKGDKLFYSLAIDPENSDIYVSDAIDYQLAGIIYLYSKQGKMISNFKVGIIPGHFCFSK